MENLEVLNDALAGKHGPEAQGKAEDAVKAAVDQLVRMVGRAVGGAFKDKTAGTQKFASGGIVKSGGQVMPLPAGGMRIEGMAWQEVDMPKPDRVVVLECQPYTGPARIKGVIE